MNNQINTTISETKTYMHQKEVLERLLRSELFRSYQKIFQISTDLPLELHAAYVENVTTCRESVNQNRFCYLLNKGGNGCLQCLSTQRCLAASDCRGVHSITCFAGLQETAIPVVMCGNVLAHLKTGQIVHQAPDGHEFSKLRETLDLSLRENQELRQAYMETPVVDKDKYQAMVTLLAAFSLQLNQLATKISYEIEMEDQNQVAAAKDYIEKNLKESIKLDEVAATVNMSSYHFCRKFKEATGVTLTNYVSQCRIELAKEALANVRQRITDIAFDVGFQSLSQFNRSFRKIVGVSPTEFRKSSSAA